jgi:hypothetical protein
MAQSSARIGAIEGLHRNRTIDSIHFTGWDWKCVLPDLMKSYDDMKSILEAQLSRAVTNHECEITERHRTGEALAVAVERLQRFVLHGMIPEDITDEESEAIRSVECQRAGSARRGSIDMGALCMKPNSSNKYRNLHCHAVTGREFIQ